MVCMELTDPMVIGRAKAGDAESFRLLVERHSHPLFRLAYRMTGNEHDADDVVQETFLRAFRQLGRFEERADVGTWLHRIAVNCALDLIRARGRHDKHVSGGTEEIMKDDVTANDPQPDRLALSREVQQHVDAALGQLSANERTAFVLRHFEGLGVEEIGSVLGLQSNAAKNTIFRAVRKLRDALEPLVRSMS